MLLAVSNGCPFKSGDLVDAFVDVFVGTASNSRGNKPIAFRGRLTGVRLAGRQERFLVRPIVGTQRGRCAV